MELTNSEEFELKEILEFEKETLGFYVSGHPLDEFREELEKINYTLSSDLENIKDGSSAIFVGKVEEIQRKVSKKGNTFGIMTLMDLHGSLEIMLFEDRLKQLEEMDLEQPIAIKAKITHTEMFTRIGVTKLMTLKEAKKESKKVKTQIEEKPQSPLELVVKLDMGEKVLEDLYRLVRQNPGNRELRVRISSKLKDIVIESSIRVSNNILEALEGNEAIDIVA